MTLFLRYLARNAYFTFRDLLRNITRALISSFGIIFLIAFLVVYLSLRQAVQEYIGGSLFGSLQINEVMVTQNIPEAKGFFQASADISGIDPAKVKRISRIPGIAKIHPVIRMEYPVKVRAELLGNRMREYMPMYGISQEFLRKSDKQFKTFAAGKDIPVIIPKIALELFNSVVSGRGLPRFGEKLLIGFPLEIEIQTSARGDSDKKLHKYTARVYGFSSAITFPGLIVPSDFITRFSNAHRTDSPDRPLGYQYTRLYLTVKNVKELPVIAKRIQSMGLIVDSQQEVAAKTNRALSIIDSSSMFIIGIFLLLTVISIFNAYLTIVYHRSYQFSLQRVIGMSKLRIIVSFVLEAALIGAIFGVVGYYGGIMLIEYVSSNISVWIPALKGLSFTHNLDGRGILLMSIGLSALLSSVSALIPAVLASNMNLFKAVQR